MSNLPKAVVITGGTSDIGIEVARGLLRQGVRVGLVGRDQNRLHQRQEEIGQPVELFIADLKQRDLSRLHADVTSRMPDVSGLVHAAGVWHDDTGKLQGPHLEATPMDVVDDVLDVGLRAAMGLARIFLPTFIAQHGGKMVFMSCGFAGPHEAVGWLHYYVTNLAVRHFVEGLAAENRANEIQVNAVAPWYVATEPVRRLYPSDAATALDPKVVAEAIIYLLSSAADNMSGQTLELRSVGDHG